MAKQSLTAALLLIIVSACSVFKSSPKYQLSDGYYTLRADDQKPERVYVKMEGDSMRLFPNRAPQANRLNFKKPSFDVDVLTVPFKFRPSTSSLPRQVTTDFNGNLYFGYRLDRFGVSKVMTPAGIKKELKHRAISTGVFWGMGSTFVSPWTTNNQTTDEYSGLVFSKGVVVMAGINNLTVGFGLGWDNLTDRDKHIWIYQNKPWYGLTIGLNLN